MQSCVQFPSLDEHHSMFRVYGCKGGGEAEQGQIISNLQNMMVNLQSAIDNPLFHNPQSAKVNLRSTIDNLRFKKCDGQFVANNH